MTMIRFPSRRELNYVRRQWGRLPKRTVEQLQILSRQHGLSVLAGDVIYLSGSWYVTHVGLLRLARREGCIGIDVRPLGKFCDPAASRWAFKATVYTSRTCRGFVGYGDADPTNVSPRVRGAEMRMAETRAANRALRKAYGIGICSVEELGSCSGPLATAAAHKKPVRSETTNGNGNSSGNGHRLRDRLCLIIRQHQLDPTLVKLYAADFCETKELRDASREQVAEFIQHLEQFTANDRDGLICQLNSYAAKSQAVAEGGAA